MRLKSFYTFYGEHYRIKVDTIEMEWMIFRSKSNNPLPIERSVCRYNFLRYLNYLIETGKLVSDGALSYEDLAKITDIVAYNFIRNVPDNCIILEGKCHCEEAGRSRALFPLKITEAA